MSEEEKVDMIKDCARMEAAFELLRKKMYAYDGTGRCLLGNKDLNEVLSVAGYRTIEIEKSPTAEEQ